MNTDIVMEHEKMKLYNTMGRELTVLEPQSPPHVTLYTCGLTVYDYGHIGNFRTFLFYDVLRRALTHNGYDVEHVMNITDVGHLVSDEDAGEDKLAVGAAREGKTAWDVAEFFIKAYHEDREKLNILPPTIEPRATDHIAEQIELVQKLEAGGFTYVISDGVYFDTARLDDYGKLAKLDIEGLQAGARVEVNPEKRNVTDFALWKFSAAGDGASSEAAGGKRDMEWESPWGVGFPGWHLECSAMAMKYCGNTLDIHCGGIDHIPVHHTNEIAQSEAVSGVPFANIWMHADFLQVDGAKMSKSKNNFYTVSDITQRGISPLAFRYLVLSAQYSSPLNFTWKSLESAASAYASLVYTASKWTDVGSVDERSMIAFNNAINHDLNTSEALAVLWGVVKSKELSDGDKAATIAAMDTVLGLNIILEGGVLRDRMEAAGADFGELLERRATARGEKDWATSDALRDEIIAKGFQLEDTVIDGVSEQVLKPLS